MNRDEYQYQQKRFSSAGSRTRILKSVLGGAVESE